MPTERTSHGVRAIRRPHPARRAITIGAVAIAGMAMLAGSSLAAPLVPEPTLDEVKIQVEALYHDMEVAAEAFNEAEVEADESRGILRTLRANLAGLRRDHEDASSAAGALAAAQYRNAGLDPVIEMMLRPDDGSRFLYRLSQLDHLADQQASAVVGLSDAQAAVALQESSIRRETARLDTITTTLDTARAEAEAKHQEAQTLLDRLTAEEAARLAAELAAAAAAAEAAAVAEAQAIALAQLAESADYRSLDPPMSPRARIAIAYALLQVGDAYVWAAEGPDAYDCSGLTMMAWNAAGVSLPHHAASQALLGSPVPLAELQPGDLVFYNAPVTHVAMYVGNGRVVHAANPMTPIGFDRVDVMPITATRRVG